MRKSKYPTNLDVGEVIGAVTVIRKTDEKLNKEFLWEVECECGAKMYRRGSDLRKNRRDGIKIACQRCKNKTHGDSLTTEFVTWSGIIKRCYNPKQTGYEYYGGRGIKMCDRWRSSYENFLEDMGRKPDPKFSIERVDVEGDYEPENCVWGSPETQARNRRVRIGSKSGKTGVSWCNTKKRWIARIKIKGKRVYLGSYAHEDLEDAIKAREEAEKTYWN